MSHEDHRRTCHRHDETYSSRAPNAECPLCYAECIEARLEAVEDRLSEPPRDAARWMDQSELDVEVGDGE